MPWNKDGTRKKSTYTMKYQGNHGAFPFKTMSTEVDNDSPLDLAFISPAIERGMERRQKKKEIKDLQHQEKIHTIEANITEEELRKRNAQRKKNVLTPGGGTGGTGGGGDIGGTGGTGGTGGSGGGTGGSGGGGGGA